MITIIHGTDSASSRKYFLEQKDTASDGILTDGQNLTVTDLVQLFQGGELFAKRKNFLIDQLIGKRKKSKELDQILEFVNQNGQDNNIYIWENKELTPASIKSLQKPLIKTFKLPQALFLFLENIRPNNGNLLISLFHQTIKNSDAEMVFSMMIRQVRTLLAFIDPGNNQIDEVKRMAPWQTGKIHSQAKLFSKEELVILYNKLFEIEKGLKTGTLSSNITSTIDFLLLEI